MLTRDVVFALLEDGPHALEELAGWLEITPARLAPGLAALGVRTCERCARWFIPKQGTSGRFCSRRCYAPAPGPSHAAKPKPAPPPHVPPVLAGGEDETEDVLDALDQMEPEDPELLDVADEPDARQPPAPRRIANAALRQLPAKPLVGEAPSWWVGLDREQLAREAAAQQKRLRESKFAHTLPVRMLS